MENVLYLRDHCLSSVLFELAASLKSKEPAERTLDLLSQRSALRILAALQQGEVRFNALAKRTGASANTVRARLAEFAEAGILERTIVRQMPPHVSFRLTPKGVELVQVLGQLLDWELRWRNQDPPARAAVSIAAEEIKPYRPA